MGKLVGAIGYGQADKRGEKLLEFLNYFNLVVLNLLSLTSGPLYTSMSENEKLKSVIDFIIVLSTFLPSIHSCTVSEWSPDLLSDHVSISARIGNYCLKGNSWPSTNKFGFEKKSIKWDRFNKDTISSLYERPLAEELSAIDFEVPVDQLHTEIVSSIWSVSEANLDLKRLNKVKRKSTSKPKSKKMLSNAVSKVRKELNALSVAQKENDSEEIKLQYVRKRTEYRTTVMDELKLERQTRISELCNASEVDEKLFWKLVKGNLPCSQFGSFLIDGKFSSCPDEILSMWFNHFKSLGMTDYNLNYDDAFQEYIEKQVFYKLLSNFSDPETTADINKPTEYEEVTSICQTLTTGTSGGLCQTTYEHIKFGRPYLWYKLYHSMFETGNRPSKFPLFKGKGLKASEKDNYRGITLFPVILEVFEMIIPNRLEKFAKDKGYFSHLQFGFKAGTGCMEASFLTNEAINHFFERGGKVFACFLDVRKAFDTVWIYGLMHKLLPELGVQGKMFSAIRSLYSDIQCYVYFNGTTTDLFL